MPTHPLEKRLPRPDLLQPELRTQTGHINYRVKFSMKGATMGLLNSTADTAGRASSGTRI
jgi:hypothetical protein